MATLHRAVATLNIAGDDVDPVQITELLGGQPSRSWRKGDDIRVRPDCPQRIAPRGLWAREASSTEPADPDAQVMELLCTLTADVLVWRELSMKFHVSVFCGWFMFDLNEGVDLAPKTLSMLGERGIRLGLDIYAP